MISEKTKGANIVTKELQKDDLYRTLNSSIFHVLDNPVINSDGVNILVEEVDVSEASITQPFVIKTGDDYPVELTGFYEGGLSSKYNVVVFLESIDPRGVVTDYDRHQEVETECCIDLSVIGLNDFCVQYELLKRNILTQWKVIEWITLEEHRQRILEDAHRFASTLSEDDEF